MAEGQVVIDPQDGGLTSRKFWAMWGCVVLVGLGGLMAAKWPGFAPSYTTYVGGIVALYGVFAGANVAHNWVAGNVNVKAQQQNGDDSAEK